MSFFASIYILILIVGNFSEPDAKWFFLTCLTTTFILCLIIFQKLKKKYHDYPSKVNSFIISSVLLGLMYLIVSFNLFKVSLNKSLSSVSYSQQETRLNELFDEITKSENGKHDTLVLRELSNMIRNINGDWQEIKSNEGRFRIEFPNFKVKKELTKQLLEGEVVKIYSYQINAQDKIHDNLAYSLDYSFWPNIKTKEQIEEKFNNQRDYIISSTNSNIEYETIIDTLEYAGRELFLTIDNSKIKGMYRMYFNDGIFYNLMVVTKDGNHFNKSISRFHNSFKLLKNE